ncbi:MAG: 4Fe-4S dicluster domain-containing protein [Spirochaetales bacterium]|jgi:dissimilatory sulfite reductase (desulfoviridin) alpha/beta subunit|nr:4Fe-4S dicluster domain-containing protein [Spirochaetales bacterium]
MAEVDYAALKKGGFMRQIQKDKFSMRLKVIGGQLKAEQLQKISEVARKYGRGYVHLTSRQGVEVPFISVEDIEAVKKELAGGGVSVGVCGPRVRTVTACQGLAVCPSGAIETTNLAEELDGRYFGKELPHKFKIGITGCKNNCLKAEENDLGVKGGVFPEWKQKDCSWCGLCEAVCPPRVVKVDKEKQTLAFEKEGCVYCGKCVKSCPSGAWEGKGGYLLSFGGMFGNEIKEGLHLLPIVFEKDKVFKAADATIQFYRSHGRAGERMGKTLIRVGAEVLKKDLEEALK